MGKKKKFFVPMKHYFLHGKHIKEKGGKYFGDSVKTVDFSSQPCSKEGKNSSIGQKGHGHKFWGFS